VEEDMNSDIKNGTAVSFSLSSEVYGKGLIKGIATNGVPVLGKSYIVETTELSVPWEYPCVTVFESQMI